MYFEIGTSKAQCNHWRSKELVWGCIVRCSDHKAKFSPNMPILFSQSFKGPNVATGLLGKGAGTGRCIMQILVQNLVFIVTTGALPNIPLTIKLFYFKGPL